MVAQCSLALVATAAAVRRRYGVAAVRGSGTQWKYMRRNRAKSLVLCQPYYTFPLGFLAALHAWGHSITTLTRGGG